MGRHCTLVGGHCSVKGLRFCIVCMYICSSEMHFIGLVYIALSPGSLPHLGNTTCSTNTFWMINIIIVSVLLPGSRPSGVVRTVVTMHCTHSDTEGHRDAFYNEGGGTKYHAFVR